MKRHRAQADYDVAQIHQDEHPGVGIRNDIPQALDPEPHKDEVCQRVDHLGAVEGDVVILEGAGDVSIYIMTALILIISQNKTIQGSLLYLLAPIQS